MKDAKLVCNKRKTGGGTTFRATLPTAWVRDMGLSEDIRDIVITYSNKKIIIEGTTQKSEGATQK